MTASQASITSCKASEAGFHLSCGPCPTKGLFGQKFQTNPKHPGVAFLIADFLTFRCYTLPDFMAPWVNKGFLFAVSIYLQGEWVDFLSVYVPQTDEGLALRQDLHLFMLNHGHSKVAICGDFNCPVTELSHGLFSS